MDLRRAAMKAFDIIANEMGDDLAARGAESARLTITFGLLIDDMAAEPLRITGDLIEPDQPRKFSER